MVHPLSPTPSLFIHSHVHSFIHSSATSTPSLDRPPHTKAGASLLTPGGVGESGVRCQPLRVCNCSGPRRPQRQWSCPGTTWPHPFIRPVPVGRAGAGLSASRSDPKSPWEDRKFLQLGKGQGGKAGGRWRVSGINNCGLCPLRSWGPGSGIIWGRQSQWMRP